MAYNKWFSGKYYLTEGAYLETMTAEGNRMIVSIMNSNPSYSSTFIIMSVCTTSCFQVVDAFDMFRRILTALVNRVLPFWQNIASA